MRPWDTRQGERVGNTEPFLRLVLEASTPAELKQREEELIGILGEPAE